MGGFKKPPPKEAPLKERKTALKEFIPNPNKLNRRKKVDGKYVRAKGLLSNDPVYQKKFPLAEDERYETRPEVLLRARKTYEKNTGRKAKAVKTALLYKDFTDYEKEEYKTLLGG